MLAARTKVITIIEPEEPLRMLLQYNAEAEGYDLRGFPSVESFREDSSSVGSLLIIDIAANKDEAVELIREIRQRNSVVPIFILTALEEEDAKVEGLSSGASDYIVKPFSVLEFFARIKAAFRTVDAFNERDAFDGFSYAEKMFLLAHRLDAIAANIAELRVNAAGEFVDSMRQLSVDMRTLAEAAVQGAGAGSSNSDVREVIRSTLPILANLFDVLGSRRGAEMAVAGAVAGIIGLGGWPSVTAYGLSLAAWMGKDAFMRAVESLGKDVPKE